MGVYTETARWAAGGGEAGNCFADRGGIVNWVGLKRRFSCRFSGDCIGYLGGGVGGGVVLWKFYFILLLFCSFGRIVRIILNGCGY